MDLSKDTKKVYDLINTIRENPSSQAKKLSTVKRALDRAKQKPQARALESFINTLYEKEPVNTLKLSEGLCRAAEAKVNDIIKNGKDELAAIKMSEVESLASEHTASYSNLWALLDFGDPDQFLSRVVVSEYDAYRGVEKIIFDEKYNFAGICVLPYKDDDLSVIIFASDVNEKSSGGTTTVEITHHDKSKDEKKKYKGGAHGPRHGHEKSEMEKQPVVEGNYKDIISSFQMDLNKLRSDPRSMVSVLEEYCSYFKDNVISRPNEIPLQTTEGESAFRDAIKFLRKQKGVKSLTLDPRLCFAAQELADDLGKSGNLAHESTDGSNLSDRIDAHCEWETACSESVDLGSTSSKHFLISLLVDDGVEGRPNRLNLFREDFKYFGIGAGPHNRHEMILVVNYAVNLRDKGKPFFEDKGNVKFQYPQHVNTDPNKKVVKSAYQLEDDDAPNNTTCCCTKRNVALWEGRKHKTVKKLYKLSNGDYHMVEVEEV